MNVQPRRGSDGIAPASRSDACSLAGSPSRGRTLGGEFLEGQALLGGLDRSRARSADSADRLSWGEPFGNPVGGGERPGPADACLAVDDQSGLRRQPRDESHELPQLIDPGRLEIFDGYVVSRVSETGYAVNVVAWWLLVLAKQRHENVEPLRAQVLQVLRGGIAASQHDRFVNPPDVHACLQSSIPLQGSDVDGSTAGRLGVEQLEEQPEPVPEPPNHDSDACRSGASRRQSTATQRFTAALRMIRTHTIMIDVQIVLTHPVN